MSGLRKNRKEEAGKLIKERREIVRHINIFDRLPTIEEFQKNVQGGVLKLDTPSITDVGSPKPEKFITISADPLKLADKSIRVISGKLSLAKTKYQHIKRGSYVAILNGPPPLSNQDPMTIGTIDLSSYGRYTEILGASNQKHIALSEEPIHIPAQLRGVVWKIVDLPKDAGISSFPRPRRYKVKLVRNKDMSQNLARVSGRKALDASLSKLFAFYSKTWSPDRTPLCTPAESADQLSAFRSKIKASVESEKEQSHSTVKEQAKENASSLRS